MKKTIKNAALLFLMILILGKSFGQVSCLDIPKMKNYGFFKEKHCKDTIYLGVLQADSLVEIERTYILIENNLYISFINDTIFEIGQFRKFNFVSFYKSGYVRMEKKRYWKSCNIKGNTIDIIDSYSQYDHKYIRLFPSGRLVIKKNKH